MNLMEIFEEMHFFEIIDNLLRSRYNESPIDVFELDQMNFLFEILLLTIQIKPSSLQKFVCSLDQRSQKFPFFSYLSSKIVSCTNETLITFVKKG